MTRINETVEITRRIDKHRTQVFTFLKVSGAKAKKLAEVQPIYACPSGLNPEPESSAGIYCAHGTDSFGKIVKDITSEFHRRQMLNEMNGKTIAFYTLEKSEVRNV